MTDKPGCFHCRVRREALDLIVDQGADPTLIVSNIAQVLFEVIACERDVMQRIAVTAEIVNSLPVLVELEAKRIDDGMAGQPNRRAH